LVNVVVLKAAWGAENLPYMIDVRKLQKIKPFSVCPPTTSLSIMSGKK
jgi:hypothetical protein